MISTSKFDGYSDIATTTDTVCGTFVEQREELTWIAAFLTANDEVASACVADACATAQNISEDWLPASPAFATVNSAIQIQQSRITQLARLYDRDEHRGYEQTLPESLEFIVMESDAICARLDTFCRFVLVLCGIEKCLPSEAAQWLGVSRHAVEAAYCRALDALEVIGCETVVEADAGLAVWN